MKLLKEICLRLKFVITNIRAEINFRKKPKDSKIDYVVHIYNGKQKGFDLFLKTVVHDYLNQMESTTTVGSNTNLNKKDKD